MKLRAEVRANIRALSTLPDGFTARDAEAELGWSHLRTRKVLERMEKQGLFHVERIYIYIKGKRKATARASECNLNRRTKVKHYRLTQAAKDQKLPECDIGTIYCGRPSRIINSVFQLGAYL